MLFIEENFRSETSPLPPSQSPATTSSADELTRPYSNTSSFATEICKDAVYHQDDCTEWTDKRHNSYLNDLEVSFVKELYQSKGLLSQCSKLDQMDLSLSKKRCIGVRISPEQQCTVLRNGSLQRIDCEKAEPLSYTSDSHVGVKNPLISRFRRGMFFSKGRHGKGIITHGLATTSKQLPENSTYYDDLTREGSDQNFVDEDTQLKSFVASQTKKVKTDSVDSSCQDQIAPSRNSPPTLSDCTLQDLSSNRLH